ncbi:metaxin protein [Dioscorea alata]|uniref:Metaxin protein n=1 Tax=Dioscorea alata TaxID=55571 RepID=A0ACB7VCX1_DIOAL|nr:metaxin protein [Dioscorea alata]
MSDEKEEGLVLVARKGGFGLPTACPDCLPVYLHLKLAHAQFDLQFDVANPDSDHVPYVECGDYVTFNNEKGGVMESLKEDNIVDLDSKLQSNVIPEWLSTKAMICSWLTVAAQYELWVASDGSVADTIYFSDLSWPIRKALHWKQTQAMKKILGTTTLTAADKEEEIYRKAAKSYEALSWRLGDQPYFFENRPTSVDSMFLGHALFVLHVLPDTSVLRSNLLKHNNLVSYAGNLKAELLEASSSSSVPRSPFDASTSTPRRRASQWKSKPKQKPKKEKTEEEKTFRRRAKYFLAAQFVAILVFLSLLGGTNDPELDAGDDEMAYED